MKVKFNDKNEWEIPVIPQYEDYEYRALICCECCELNVVEQEESHNEGIVGIAEDSYGRLMALHICPRCGKKWRCHIVTKFDSPKYAIDILSLILYTNKEKYRNFEIKNKIEKGL